MSDFDKEAERQRLREKYEAEREDREATQHMSELLLKGATMTNSHCGTCGDPVFRHDGQEFCPTCSNQVQADATANADADPTADGTTADADPTADGTAADREPVATDGETPTPARADRSASTDATANRERATADDSTPRRDATPATPTAGARDAASTPGDAVANVEATVERFAAAAADTDDPERARECLAVVRDATDTLRTLRGDGQ